MAQEQEDLSCLIRKLEEEYQEAELEINLHEIEYLTITEEDVKIKGTSTYIQIFCIHSFKNRPGRRRNQ